MTIDTRQQLLGTINSQIKLNGTGAITGPILNNVLDTMVNSALFQTGAWSQYTSYAPLDVVEYLGNAYVANVANVNIIPSTDPSTWTPFSSASAVAGLSGYVQYNNGTGGLAASSNLTFDGTNLNASVTATGATTSRTLANHFADVLNVKDFGATGNGSTDDSSSFNASNSAPSILIPAGNYVLNSNVSFYVPVTIMSGAILKIANGVTVSFIAQLNAGVHQIFSITGSGLVQINTAATTIGYPEWWGAVANSGSTDCLAAIQYCIQACPVTQLQAADYFISNTLKITTANRILQGYGFDYLNYSGSATRIVLTNGTGNVLQIGPDTQPSGGINYFLTDVTVQNLQVTRSVVSVAGSSCSGLIAQFTLYTFIEKVKSTESQYGFHYTGTVNCHTSECYSFRSSLGSGGGSDLFYGYYIDGISNNIGAAGGNASIYFTDCNASCGGSYPTSCSGIYMNGGYTDTYIIRPECNSMFYGIALVGNSSTTQNYANNDVLIVEPVCDGFTGSGIYFINTSEFGSININGGYSAPASGASSVVAGLYFNNSYGQIMVNDYQVICAPNSLCRGIAINGGSNIETRTQIIDCAYGSGAISVTNVTNSRFMDHVTNYAITCGPACEVAGTCTANYFQVFASGKSSAFTFGYQLLSTGTTRSEFNCTGLDSSSISSGSGNKLVYNGTQITSTGTFGTNNLASGVMG